MQDAVGADPGKRPTDEWDPEDEVRKTRQKINDFSPTAHKYVRQRRIYLQVKIGREIIEKLQITGYQKVVHRDQFDTQDSDKRQLLVDSDETTVIIIAKMHDPKNVVGRDLRLGGAKPICSLDQMLSAVVDIGRLSLDGGHEDDDPGPDGDPPVEDPADGPGDP